MGGLLFFGNFSFANVSSQAVVSAGCSHWIKIETSCGKTAKLCADDYDNGLQVLVDAAGMDETLCGN